MHLDAGFDYFKRYGVALPDETVECVCWLCIGHVSLILFPGPSSPSATVHSLALSGAFPVLADVPLAKILASSPSNRVAGYNSPIVGLRRALDLYANIRPVLDVSLSVLVLGYLLKSEARFQKILRTSRP